MRNLNELLPIIFFALLRLHLRKLPLTLPHPGPRGRITGHVSVLSVLSMSSDEGLALSSTGFHQAFFLLGSELASSELSAGAPSLRCPAMTSWS